MLQKPWFKVFVWFISSFFFFLASAVVISIFKPGPSEAESMKFMAGMMGAMENSIMGVMMQVEQNYVLKNIILISAKWMTSIIIISIILGIIIRVMQGRTKNV